ncbi:MAG: 50S ribosomal protein L24 [Oscillospiraceae bacterium]|jgi:large subunit ribosomal protein L24|nr:50S ribosomal protein L24 [Oscillospiraceae bacterium]
MKLKRDDNVVVLSGKDKGKRGKIISVDPKGGKVIVEGVNVATMHRKPRRAGDNTAGIVKMETPIYASKVQRVCPKCDKPTRIAYKFAADGSKSRACKKCGEEI